MADINEVHEEIKQDEIPHAIPMHRKDGTEFTYEVADNSNEPFPIEGSTTKAQTYIEVLGEDSKRVKAARDQNQKKLLGKRRIKLEPKDLRANRITVVKAAITGWKGWTAAGKEFPCTPENIEALMTSSDILQQVEEGISDHADFSPTASS